MQNTVVVFDPVDVVASANPTTYCNECCDFIPRDEEGQLMCSMCNPEYGMQDVYDEEAGLHELNFHDEDDHFDRS